MVTSHAKSSNFSSTNTFVIPHDIVFEIAAEIVEKGKVERGSLGVEFTTMSYTQKIENNTGYGAIVDDVGGYQEGQRPIFTTGDIIQRFNGASVRNADDLNSFLVLSDPEDEVRIGFLREGRQYSTDIRLQ